MRATISVSPKYQITLVEEIRRLFPFLKPGEKVVLDVDPKTKRITIEPLNKLDDFVGILSDYSKDLSTEEEEKPLEESLTKQYAQKYGKESNS